MSQQINLFNPIFRQQKKYLSAVTIAQALGVILLGLTLLAGYVSYRSSQLNVHAAAVEVQLKAAQDRLAKVAITFAPRQKSKELEQEIRRIEAETQSLQKVADILQVGELGNTKGYANYFRAFSRQIVDGLWLTGFGIHGAGTEIELQGRALRPELIPAYINRLKNEQVLQGKSFSNLEMHVPKAAPDRAGEAANKPAVAANYIEFSLQSTGLSRQGAHAAGVTNK